MKKKMLLFWLIGIMCMITLTGCNNGNSGLNNPSDIESYYQYGFMEKCLNSSGYLQIDSIEISPTYTIANESTYNNGYYVALGIQTNLTENDFLNSNNLVELRVSSNKSFNLNFTMYDLENEKLVYQIPMEDSFDYSQLCNLRVSETNKVNEYPFLGVFIDCFNQYCTIDGIQYCGRCIILRLK